MKDKETSIEDLKIAVSKFVHERDWERYHNPKDLAESICIEAAELLQLFQWRKPKDGEGIKSDPSNIERIKHELADVVVYCLSMANTLDLDLSEVVLNKIEQNEKKYPADLYKGKAHLS
ncbi:MAG: nucleotide pyrophosphohydrolase [Candidatus Bathyarchaeota archaeon]|nr:MAG: nucleotide pyrophosphohydrolase [Candidatus Bathyarchaeota archaeon]